MSRHNKSLESNVTDPFFVVDIVVVVVYHDVVTGSVRYAAKTLTTREVPSWGLLFGSLSFGLVFINIQLHALWLLIPAG